MSELPAKHGRVLTQAEIRLQNFLTLNFARFDGVRVHYKHSIEKLRRLARQHARRYGSREKLKRILAMVESRSTITPGQSLPKKIRRKMGLLPALA